MCDVTTPSIRHVILYIMFNTVYPMCATHFPHIHMYMHIIIIISLCFFEGNMFLCIIPYNSMHLIKGDVLFWCVHNKKEHRSRLLNQFYIFKTVPFHIFYY